ncbi:MAG: PaaI family thioesterase [Acidobacteriota bacterium]
MHLPTYRGCIVCGDKDINPSTLNLRFRTSASGVEADFLPQPAQEGYKGIIHGGVLCSILDETIGWAVAVARRKYFVTAELAVRFLRPLAVGTKTVVRGRAVEHQARYSIAEGEIVDLAATVYARATGKFFVMPDEKALGVRRYLTFREDDVDFYPDSG